jgi:hypothetical protein
VAGVHGKRVTAIEDGDVAANPATSGVNAAENSWAFSSASALVDRDHLIRGDREEADRQIIEVAASGRSMHGHGWRRFATAAPRTISAPHRYVLGFASSAVSLNPIDSGRGAPANTG